MNIELSKKIVFITGASSGIGRACAEQFAQKGARLLLCARRESRLTDVVADLKQRFQSDIYSFPLNVSDSAAVERKLQELPTEWQPIDILINNAGLALGLEKLQEGNIEDWDTMIDTNVKGVLYISRQVLGTMLKRNQGHIINIGSISSHQVYSGGVVYCATKFALKAISEGLKMDVHGTPIRVSSVDPGMVETEFSAVRFGGDQKKVEAVYKGFTPLKAEDIAEAVLFCATRPLHVDVRAIKIYPTAQTAAHLISRGN
ncbi:SDR family NAD(P)-dependent oxidoreductase [Coxiella burnetii]|uniref:SDR family NAD(P)-dependent oxidoreductase n=1 Tax=Coxiella burnetii TaxID=777 RepID=UPI000183CF27|nr:SDR family NAD(P)-dependent oxidoreductase [Coxiella burnetii]ACJ17917.1 short chain dehydrogenase [Coxiella burnetii CbuG_Q212]ATN66339.1 NAD(P)-dependent oxidoreductase [Coxiella burnetii]OYK86705.1 NAD(P)-dependent oxidoreductase [Coxiella burnetii]